MRVRGLPYRHTSSLANVYVSMGLWRGSPDLDAIATLTDQPTDALAGARTRVMPSYQYFPLSGMNLAFRRDVACLMYFAPMGAGQPFSRFDDIWCGLVVQRVFRHLGYSIVCGRPWINHRRASDPFVNLVKEAPGIGANENLWQTIDAIPLSGNSPKDCMQEVAAELAAQSDEYLADWGRRIASWCDLFGRVDDDVEVQPIAET
jgi:reversibly glycosylated polypeptide/UDP-arabinopyranose mutase